MHRRLIDLLVLGGILAALRIDIVCKHVLAIIDTTLCWLSVGAPIRMESWLAVVSRERRVSNPSRCAVKFTLTFF